MDSSSSNMYDISLKIVWENQKRSRIFCCLVLSLNPENAFLVVLPVANNRVSPFSRKFVFLRIFEIAKMATFPILSHFKKSCGSLNTKNDKTL